MPDFMYGLASLGVGFALAGSLTHGYQLFTARRLTFALLLSSGRATSLAAIPLLVFAAPFLIVRNTVRGAAGLESRIGLIAIATALAGFWSLMSGSVVAAGWLELVACLA